MIFIFYFVNAVYHIDSFDPCISGMNPLDHLYDPFNVLYLISYYLVEISSSQVFFNTSLHVLQIGCNFYLVI